MKATLVQVAPTKAATKKGRRALPPELLGSVGARYSRSDEGLEGIMAKIDTLDPEKSIDSIFRQVDFGHRSITDMAGAAVFVDGVSLHLAYEVWAQVQTAAGQETSTRYVRIKPEGLIDPERLGIPARKRQAWHEHTAECFNLYTQAVSYWESLAREHPEYARLPQSVLEDTSEAGIKKRKRMERNFAFDRSRYFLPVGCATNVMLIMSGRAWVELLQFLLSHYLPEACELGEKIRAELELSIPRSIKHGVKQHTTTLGLTDEFEDWMEQARRMPTFPAESREPFLEVFPPSDVDEGAICAGLERREHRYAWFGKPVKRTAVRFGWPAAALAEIRDLNRHRTGSKYCPLVPQGFYGAFDQCPPGLEQGYEQLITRGMELSRVMLEMLKEADTTHVYWGLLGTEFPFEHTTTLDKAIYEWELRTGTGAHYKYADMVRGVLGLFYTRYPKTKGLIHEGQAEPE